MPPACICLTQGNSFLRINLTQKNASAIGGILSPAGLPTSTQSLSTETQETQKKISHFQEKKGESDKRFIPFDAKKKTNPKRTKDQRSI